MPISMWERSAKGTSRVTSSQSNTAKLHMSADLLLMSSGLFCNAGHKMERDKNHSRKSRKNACLPPNLFWIKQFPLPNELKKRTGNTFRGHPCRRVHPTGTLEGELSICHAYSGSQVLIDLCTDHCVINTTCCHRATVFHRHMFKQLQEVRRRPSPWCVCCWGRNVKPLVLRCGEKPCHWRCQEQTSRLDFGPRRELMMQKEMKQGTKQQSGQSQINENYQNMDRKAFIHIICVELFCPRSFCPLDENWNHFGWWFMTFTGAFTERNTLFPVCPIEKLACIKSKIPP